MVGDGNGRSFYNVRDIHAFLRTGGGAGLERQFTGDLQTTPLVGDRTIDGFEIPGWRRKTVLSSHDPNFGRSTLRSKRRENWCYVVGCLRITTRTCRIL